MYVILNFIRELPPQVITPPHIFLVLYPKLPNLNSTKKSNS
jgi:hypothetical protein